MSFFKSIKKSRLIICVLVTLLLSASTVSAQDDKAEPLTEQDIFQYLDQSIAWYRDVTAIDIARARSRELILNSSLKTNALKALRLSFVFARIQATILEEAKLAAATQKLGPEQPVDTEAKGDAPVNMARVKLRVQDKIKRIENDLAAVAKDIARAKAGKRPILMAKRDKLTVEMALAQQQMQLVEAMIASSKESDDESLMAQIDNLAGALPELEKKKKSTATATSQPVVASTIASSSSITPLTAIQLPSLAPESGDSSNESKGIIRLGGDMITIMRQKRDLTDIYNETVSANEANDDMLKRVRDALMVIIRRGNALGEGTQVNGLDDYHLQTQELDQLTTQFKQLSQLIVPLTEQKAPLAASLRLIDEWQQFLNEKTQESMRDLCVRLLSLAIAIIIPLILSEIGRRATLKYIQDAKRRRQLNIMRRVVVGVLIGLIVTLNLMTEFGSMATFIGFLTAGLAVALQNVILSAVAYFFFFGRYGIRQGSRVSVYGTTGEVIETGLVRLYLMELVEEEGKWQPTGRIVAFPNSILFHPTAFFKQVPGAKFQQHEMTFLLTPDIDRAVASRKLREAAKAIYDDSRSLLEIQKSALEQASNIKAKIPKPKGVLVENGDSVGFVMRFPIAADRANNIDESAQRIILDILEREPKLSRLNDDPPEIRSF